MLKTLVTAVAFMTHRERIKYLTFLGFRAFIAVFDLLGILAVGFLATSVALFITLGSDSNRIVEFGGIAIPAVTAKTLPIIAILIFVLFLSKAVIAILLTRQLAYFLAKIEARAAKTIAQIAFGAGLGEVRKNSPEEIHFAVQAGSPAAFNSLLNSVGTIVAEGLLFCLVIGSFFIVDPFAALGALIYFGLIGVIIQFFLGNLMQKAASKTTEGVVEANLAISDLGEVFREATILNIKDFFFAKIADARNRTASSNASQFVLGGMPRYIVETALIIAVAMFILLQSASGDIVTAAGTVGVFLSGGLRLTASLLPLQSALLGIKQSIPYAEKALKFIGKDTETPIELSGIFGKPNSTQPAVRVELNDVFFSYPGAARPTIRNLNLRIDRGQQAALIGVSGSGKSTIADLILGLLEPARGNISLDGMPPIELIRTCPGKICYVPQKPGMISGSIVENIALGVSGSEVDEARLQYSIDAAHLRGVVDSLPNGLATDLGKRKDELSGGQLQRIGLARALYTNPSLLVMDEATSALDAESEHEINKALNEMRGTVTVVLIAHRLNTVQKSDVVFLVEDGEVTASGAFPDLLRSNRTVQKLAELMTVYQSKKQI